MQYAIVQSGGKQYKVKQGDIIELAHLGEKEGPMTFTEVLLVSDEGKVTVGAPFVPNMRVAATILGPIKGEKIRVAKFKAKARYRRVTGFRALLTRVQIDAIGDSKKAAAPAVKEEVSKAEKSAPAKKTATKRATKAQAK